MVILEKQIMLWGLGDPKAFIMQASCCILSFNIATGFSGFTGYFLL